MPLIPVEKLSLFQYKTNSSSFIKAIALLWIISAWFYGMHCLYETLLCRPGTTPPTLSHSIPLDFRSSESHDGSDTSEQTHDGLDGGGSAAVSGRVRWVRAGRTGGTGWNGAVTAHGVLGHDWSRHGLGWVHRRLLWHVWSRAGRWHGDHNHGGGVDASGAGANNLWRSWHARNLGSLEEGRMLEGGPACT